jgi:hypothetical protein
MKVHGSCHCGAVRYEATVDPARVSICHCTDCQQLTGSAYRLTVFARRDDLRLLAGEPKTYVKIGSSGARRAQVFCGDCGSPLWAHAVEDAQTVGLRVGALEERRALAPQRQIWCRSALPWVADIRSVPAVERE